MLALVVDDDAEIRAFVRSILRADDFETMEAENGAEALKLVHAMDGTFDMIVSDIQMPQLDGIGLANAVSKAYPSVAIILMSGYEAPEGNHEFVQKPFSWVEMRRVIRRVVREACLPPAA